MRNIKFRVWDVVNKKMRYTDYVIDPNGNVLFIHSIECSDGVTDIATGLSIRSPDQAIVMLSTGVKDANGVEIYEGDVVVFSRYKCSDRVAEVVFGRYMLSVGLASCYSVYSVGFYLKFPAPSEIGEFSWPEWSVKVVGNIYENPDLLEVSK